MKIFSWVSFLWFLYACPVIGQAAKATLTKKDYNRFGVLRNEAISKTGKWLSFSMTYESGLDTLFVSRSNGSHQFAIPKGRVARFVSNNVFCSLRKDNLFQATHLANQKSWTVPDVKRYELSGDGKHLVLVLALPDAKSTLEIRRLDGKLVKTINNVGSFSFDEQKQNVAFDSNTGMASARICRLTGKMETSIIAQGQGLFENFCWRDDGKSVAFLHREEKEVKAVLLYNLTKQLLSQNPEIHQELKIVSPNHQYLRMAPDGKAVFFTVAQPQKSKQVTGTAQVWNAADHELYSRRKNKGLDLLWIKWDTVKDSLLQIGTKDLPYALFTSDSRFAVCYNGKEYGPLFKTAADRDCYLMDLETGERILLEKQLSGSPDDIRMSPKNALVAYKHGSGWKVFDADHSKRYDLSAVKGLTFLAWMSDSRSMLFTDGCDILEADAQGKWAKRLTKGQESGLFYRLAYEVGVVDRKAIVLDVRSSDYTYSGYGILENGRYRELIFDNCRFSGILHDSAHNSFSYLTERFDTPPTLNFATAGRVNTVYRSNKFVDNLSWGKSEAVSYEVGGQELHGALFYPFGFDAGKHYPMIVHIYELQNRQLHEFVNPSLHSTYGFNISVLASEGYFVFLPDIVHRTGEPGLSATQCVVAGTKAASDRRPINPERIGLFGHSYGGYETSFIITQTDMFKCAVAGSAVTDYVSGYLSEDSNTFNVSYWRSENGQRRMGYPLYENKDGYLRNSPVYFADRVQTPLLQFTGEKDSQVTPTQSFEFHLALRRLQKENVLLVYPKENHILLENKNQEDLMQKVKDWFGFYLMDGPKKEWLSPQ